MNWQSVFFSTDGRMGQKAFWVGALILFLAWILSHVLHLLAPIAWLILTYCWICLFSKRLHDAGRSGWMTLIPFAVGCGAVMISLAVGGAAVISALATGGVRDDLSSWGVLWGTLGIAVVLWAFACLANLIFVLWVGLGRPDAGENRYGPFPSPWLRPAGPPPESAA